MLYSENGLQIKISFQMRRLLGNIEVTSPLKLEDSYMVG